jgi:ComF family protein
MFSSILALLQALFYPHCCPGCGEEVREPGVLCGRCREGVWHPRSFHPGSLGCPHVDGMFFLMDYAGAIQKTLQQAKFQGREDLLPRLGEEWVRGIRQEGKFSWDLPPEVTLCATGIPTDPRRRKKRGYDLPEEIFRPWCRQEGYRWETLLIRNRSTRPQYGLTPEERKKNIKGCFTLARQENLPDIVLLCDDICTTGSTLEEAARTLKQGGVKKVYALALASGN